MTNNQWCAILAVISLMSLPVSLIGWAIILELI